MAGPDTDRTLETTVKTPIKIETTTLATKTARLKLPLNGKPYWLLLAGGISLGYRRNEGAGTWSVRIADGKGGAPIKRLAAADDRAEADGKNILSFIQARDAAQRFASGDGEKAAPAAATTLGEVIEAYEADLIARGADTRNSRRLRYNLSPVMLKRLVSTITPKELSTWRNAMAEDKEPSGVNRLIQVFRTALRLAETHGAKLDPKWREGLVALPNAREAHNDVRPQATVVRLVHAAREKSAEFGLMVEVLAQTGARYSQVARCNVRDLLADALCLMIPASFKGKKNKKRIPARVQLPEDLIARLRLAAGDRPGNAPLLRKPDGERWAEGDLAYPFEGIAKAIGEEGLTSYALRHTHITAQLLARIPVEVVAKLHDTSGLMIAQHYAFAIADHSDDLVRATIVPIDQPQDNVVPLRHAR